MPSTAGTGDPHVVGLDSGTLSGRADVVRDGRGRGTGSAGLTGTPDGSTTLGREGCDR
jgi:hypothetical protein